MSNYYGNYNKKKKGSALQTVVCILLSIILLGVIAGGIFVGVKSEGFRNWDYFKGEQTEQPKEEQPSGVTDGEGNELESGTSYEMPASMVYAVPTAQSTTASSGVTVTATVLPETAINKNVTWSLAFADASASWAQGKTVTDYVTVTADTENSREATVVCKQAFGEQIVLTAASVADPTKTATCTIDYAQSIVGVSAKIGNIDVVLGGQTEVTINIGDNATDRGGQISVEYTLSETYTIPEEVTTSVSFSRDESGYFYGTYTQGGPYGSKMYTYDDLTDGIGKSMYFDLRLFDNYNFQYTSSGWQGSELVTTTTDFSEFETSFLKTIVEERMAQEPKLWTISVTVTGTYSSYFETSDLILSAVDGWDEVQSIDLDKSEIVFGKE